MFMWIVFGVFICNLNLIVNAQDGKGADARSTDVNVGCFAADSMVQLMTGEEKFMGDLQTGDQLKSVNDLKIVQDEMFLMMDKEPNQQAKFYTFHTESDHQISLTSLHLIPIVHSNGDIDYIAAKNVQIGDRFYVLINNELQSSSVNNITIEMKQGYFAPLTLTGTLMVNDIFVSCFASVKNHHYAQIFMTPFRWYYQISRLFSISEPFANDNRSSGIHWLLKLIYQSIITHHPSIFGHV